MLLNAPPPPKVWWTKWYNMDWSIVLAWFPCWINQCYYLQCYYLFWVCFSSKIHDDPKCCNSIDSTYIVLFISSEILLDPAVSSKLADTKASGEVKALDTFYAMLQTEPDRAFYGWETTVPCTRNCVVNWLFQSWRLIVPAAFACTSAMHVQI